jgi:HAMP domain-containing protein
MGGGLAVRTLKSILAGFGLFFTLLAASWFGGRKSALTDVKAKQDKADLKTALRAEEIENEVEALDTDGLKRRSRKWVRNSS